MVILWILYLHFMFLTYDLKMNNCVYNLLILVVKYVVLILKVIKSNLAMLKSWFMNNEPFHYQHPIPSYFYFSYCFTTLGASI
jgi:hypothetical protein